jgi:hypothetical protein
MKLTKVRWTIKDTITTVETSVIAIEVDLEETYAAHHIHSYLHKTT